MKNNSDIEDNDFLNRNEFIDLKQIILFAKRNKKILASFTLSGLILSGAFSLLKQKVWEGQIQIVLAKGNTQKNFLSKFKLDNPDLASFVEKSTGDKNELSTQVEILKSPSVLMPIFYELKKKKNIDGVNTKNLTFSKWLDEYLDIRLTKRTSVLNLYYRDNDKSQVIKTLTDISKAYQAYSGEDRIKGIKQGIKYLDSQISIYKEKSLISRRNVQQFGIENDLSLIKSDKKKNEDSIINAINVEKNRIKASNKIRLLNKTINELDKLEDENKYLFFVASSIPELKNRKLISIKKLKLLDDKLSDLRIKYQENSKLIKQVKKERSFVLNEIKNQAYLYLKSEILAQKAIIAASKRPKGVLLKFTELARKAMRDEITLKNLEDQYQILSLEQARTEDPWELITEPMLMDEPVSPQKGKLLSLGLALGALFGGISAGISERRKGLIFNKKEIENLLNMNIIDISSLEDEKNLKEYLKLIDNNLKQDKTDNNLAIIPLGNFNTQDLNKIFNEFKKNITIKNIKLISELSEANKFNKIIYVGCLGKLTYLDIYELNKKANLQNLSNIDYFLLIN